jgi:RNA polymerase sigma factor (sigma-70 family)
MSQADLVTRVENCLTRIAAGDAAAYDELIRLSQDRLKLIARAKLDRFPRLRRWVESDDVLNNMLSRLEEDLRAVRPTSVPQFLGLVALKIRRQLTDLVRCYYGPTGAGTKHATPPAGSVYAPVDPPGDAGDDPARLAEYAELQELVGQLPEELREVVDFHCYHGLSLPEVAAVLGVSVSTVQRRFTLAKVQLAKLLGHEEELCIPRNL